MDPAGPFGDAGSSPLMGVVERGLLPRPVVTVANLARRWSLWALPASTACCTGELAAALHSPRLDAERLGIRGVDDAADANVLVVAGPLSATTAPVIGAALEQLPHPRYVVAVGACAISGGPFASKHGGELLAVDVPVDVWVPGCPPRPEAILDGLRLLGEQIGAEDPAVRWRQAGASPQGPSVLVEAVRTRDLRAPDRGFERVAEQRPWAQLPVLAARLDESGSVARSLAAASAIERLAGVTVPAAAAQTRELLVELAGLRHLTAWWAEAADLCGLRVAESVSRRARELVLDRFEALTGSRIHGDAIVVGGVAVVPSPAWVSETDAVLPTLWDWADTVDRLVFGTELVAGRLRGLAALTGDDAVSLGLAGPNLRGCGTDTDGAGSSVLPAPWPADEDVSPIPTRHPDGDAFGRSWVRLQDARRSCRSLRGLLRAARLDGPSTSAVPTDLAPGEAEVVVPHPEGTVVCALASAGADRPQRVRLQGPGRAAAHAADHVVERDQLQGLERDLAFRSFGVGSEVAVR